jgi:F-type H+-transporting ATPase subunit a
MRLFGNILAGTIITMLVYTLIKAIAPWGYLGLAITPFLHMYFDIFSGVIQTYIFFTLGSFFLGQQVSEEND